MKKQILMGLGVVLLALVAYGGFVLWRMAPTTTPASPDQMTIAATIFPLTDIAKQIGGEHVHVIQIIPPGITEHSAALTPQQLAALQSAQVIYAIGNGLENRLLENITKVKEVPVVTVDAGIALREFGAEHEEHAEEEQQHEEGTIDPHYWLMVPNAQIIAGTIAADLQERDPVHAAAYQENLKAYQEKLGNVEQELQQMAATLTQRHFISSHDAWSYFAQQYGLELVGTYEPVEGREPSLADLQHLQALVQQYGIKTFFAEPQKATSAATRLLERDFDLRIGVLDPVGGVEKNDSYEALMRRTMQAIVEGQ